MAVERTKEGVVVLDYAKVADPSADLSAAIAEAFGSEPHCLGIVVVRGIPDYVSKRQRLLPLGSALGKLPADVKAKYEVPQVNYSIGWSHGKESFQGVLDTAKGSFYANPSYDTPAPPAEGAPVSAFTHPNVWPAEVPELEPAFKDLGQLIVNVGRELAVHCDRFIKSKVPEYEENHLSNMIATSKSALGRLLHYFPQYNMPEQRDAHSASWCGWHLDHGALTGLTSAIFMKEDGEQVPLPDPTAGLYIRNRAGELVKAVIPADCLAFQMGETTQVASGGVLAATPHCVQGPVGKASEGIARNTLAVFMQPSHDATMFSPAGADTASVRVESWRPGMTFGDFSEATFKKYYY